MRAPNPQERETLERLIDDCGPVAVADALQEISDAKAAHIRESYGKDSEPTAKAWDRVANAAASYAAALRRVAARHYGVA